jgi:PAS domain S-box-containing protein
MLDNHMWLVVLVFSMIIGLYLLYLHYKSKDKRKLMFSISFLLSNLYFIGILTGNLNANSGNTSVLWVNILGFSSIPLMFAVFFAVNESFFKIKDYSKIFYSFLIITFACIFFIFLPFDATTAPHYLRQIIALEVFVATAYLYYKTRNISYLYFFLFIVSSIFAGITIFENASFSAFAFVISYIFLSLIFINPESEKSDKCGIGSYFSVEKKLKTTEEKYRKLFDTIPDGITVLSTDGIILDANETIAKNFGVEKEKIIGQNMHQMLPPDVDNQITEIALKALNTGETQENEVQRGERYFHNMYIPVKTEDDQKNLMVIARDITSSIVNEKEKEERISDLRKTELAALNIMEDMQETSENLKKTKEKIASQNKDLQKLSDIKSAFLNITSHELRTPMSSIKGYIQMMLKGNLGKINDEQKSALEVVQRNATRLDNLIQDILDISRLESGTMKFVPEKADIPVLIKEVDETMKSSASLKQITIKTEVKGEIPTLIVDKDRITQVVINLLNNAIKFSPEKSELNLRVRQDKENILFEVEDHGRGVPKDKQERIFETFFQVDSSSDVKFGGAGLGLAISRGIVIAHGGNIWVESEGVPGKGSTFKFTLPKKSVEDIESRFKGVDVFGMQSGKDEKESDEI